MGIRCTCDLTISTRSIRGNAAGQSTPSPLAGPQHQKVQRTAITNNDSTPLFTQLHPTCQPHARSLQHTAELQLEPTVEPTPYGKLSRHVPHYISASDPMSSTPTSPLHDQHVSGSISTPSPPATPSHSSRTVDDSGRRKMLIFDRVFREEEDQKGAHDYVVDCGNSICLTLWLAPPARVKTTTGQESRHGRL